MNPNMFRAIMAMMRQVQGKGAYPTYYYNLCKCYPLALSHPPPGLTGADLLAAAEKSCLVCSVVKEALTTALGSSIDEKYNIVFKIERTIWHENSLHRKKMNVRQNASSKFIPIRVCKCLPIN